MAVASAWSVLLFALLRAPWVQQKVLWPLVNAQRGLVESVTGAPVPLAVTLDCSGADVMALALGFLLAFPSPWRARLLGALGALAFIVVLNVGRIAVLSQAASRPDLFNLLHVYVLPAALVVGTAGFVIGWTWQARPRGEAADPDSWSPERRLAVLAVGLLAAYTFVTPWLATSRLVLAGAEATASMAAALMRAAGAHAEVAGPFLTMGSSSFLVTSECVLSPILPLLLAAALAIPARPARRLGLVALAVLMFAALGVARLLALALPPWLVGSPLFVAHGFRQIVAGAAAVALLAYWSERPNRPRALRRAAVAAGVGVAVAVLAGPVLGHLLPALGALARVVAPHSLDALTWPGDEQGALALLPAYQAGLLAALLVAAGPLRARAAALAFAVLLGSQLGVLVTWGEWAAHLETPVPTLAVRAWAVAAPLALALLARSTTSFEPEPSP